MVEPGHRLRNLRAMLGADDAEIDNLFGKAGLHRPEG